MRVAMIAELSNSSFETVKNELPELTGGDDIRTYKIYKAVGCPHCENTGYSGRVALAEAVEINDQLREMIIGGEKNLNVETVRKTKSLFLLSRTG